MDGFLKLFIKISLLIFIWSLFGDLFSVSAFFFFFPLKFLIFLTLSFLFLFLLQILFILLDSNLKSNERVLSYFQLKKSQLPALAVFHTPDDEHDVLTVDEISIERVQDFCNRFLQRMQKVQGVLMLLFTRLLKKVTSVPWTPPHPCHIVFHVHFHLNIREALDLGQSREGFLCRPSFFIDLCLLVYSKKNSLISAAAWRSLWSIYLLGTAARETKRRVLLGAEKGDGGWQHMRAGQKDSGMDRN